MKYRFICENDHVTILDLPMGSIKKTTMYCEECGTALHQEFSVSFKIPDSMTAADSQQVAWVNDRLKNRPTGKRRILY